MLIDSRSTVYQGSSKRLVVAFDVGTTFSGVSFCFLDPGVVPKTCSLTKYPGETVVGSSKIPTVMYYDQAGNMKCAGAEATLLENEMNAEDKGWSRVDWFKLRLRPPSVLSQLKDVKVPELPAGKNIVQVYADFFGYLMACTEKYIKDTYAAMTGHVWNTLRYDMILVLAHPNGWEGAQQQQMRRSAILANIIPNTPRGRDRVVFVTEGEASLHFCVKGQFIDDTKQGFIIADLGGGTLDFSVYKVCERAPLRVKEIGVPKCVLEGSMLVTQRAHISLEKKLKDSAYGDEKTLDLISHKFDETAKIVFRSMNDTGLVGFGSPRDQDRDHGIRGGRLVLPGKEMASFFEPSVAAIVKAINEYILACPIKLSAVYLVGGFSSSPYLKSEVELRLQSQNIKIATPDGQVVKAVADGAVSFYVDHYVAARVARSSYGISCHVKLNVGLKGHQKRLSTAIINLSGDKRIPGVFRTILKKGTVVFEKAEFRKHFSREFALNQKAIFETNVLAYLGSGDAPDWVDEMKDSEKHVLCSVQADMTERKGVTVKTSKTGEKYKEYAFEIVLLFGGPEFKAQVCWKEQGVEKRGPAEIIYQEFSTARQSENDTKGQPSN